MMGLGRSPLCCWCRIFRTVIPISACRFDARYWPPRALGGATFAVPEFHIGTPLRFTSGIFAQGLQECQIIRFPRRAAYRRQIGYVRSCIASKFKEAAGACVGPIIHCQRTCHSSSLAFKARLVALPQSYECAATAERIAFILPHYVDFTSKGNGAQQGG